MTRTLRDRRNKNSANGFVGRQSEQQRFGALLNELTALQQAPERDLTNPQIFLIGAEGGMGKSTLMRRFVTMVTEARIGRHVFLDLEQHPAVRNNTETLLWLLHDTIAEADPSFRKELAPFREAIERQKEVQRRVGEAETQYQSLASFGGRAVQAVSGGLVDHELVSDGIHAGARALADIRKAIRRSFSEEEWRLVDEPASVAEVLMDALNRIATARHPLIMFIDTYEQAEGCDDWVRRWLLSNTGTRLIWVIAGRAGDQMIQRYRNEIGAEFVAGMLLDTFTLSDTAAFLNQRGITDEQLITTLYELTRGVPIAIRGWAELHEQHVSVPASTNEQTTRREIVHRVTTRFLSYCDEQTQIQTRNAVLGIMLVRRLDTDALAALWDVTPAEAEQQLLSLGSRFSFVFADDIERQPHALVREFVREHIQTIPQLPVAIRTGLERLIAHYRTQLTLREHALWNVPIAQPLSQRDRASLVRQRDGHIRRRNDLEEQLATKGIHAESHLRADRDSASEAIADIDARLTPPQIDVPARPRRPLWEDEGWREILFDLILALCWSDRTGEQALRLWLPMRIEARWFHDPSRKTMDTLIAPLRPYWTTPFASFVDDYTPLLHHSIMAFSPLQQACVLLVRAGNCLRDKNREQEQRCTDAEAFIDQAAQLLPADGGELAADIGEMYGDIGNELLSLKTSDTTSIATRAVNVLDTAQRYNQHSRFISYSLGYAKYRLKDYDDAIAAYQHAIALDPAHVYPHTFLGLVYYDLKRYDDAIAAYQRAIALDPAYAYPHNGLGHVYHALKRYDDAIAAYQRAIALDPALAYPHHGLGNVYRDLKRYDDAIAAYQRASTLDPAYVYAHNGIALAYMETGDFEREEAAREQLALYQPDDAMNITGLARLAQQRGDTERAKALLAQAEPLLVEEDTYNKACFAAVAGRTDEAIALLQQAFAEGFQHVEWARNDPDLTSLRSDPQFIALVGAGGEEAGNVGAE